MTTAFQSAIIDRAYLVEIMNKLSSELHYKTYPAGLRFIFSANRQENCYLIKSGVVSVYRYPENVLIEIFDAPTLRGAIPVLPGSDAMYTLKVIQAAEIAVVKKEDFYNLLTKFNLWEVFSRHLQLVVAIGVEVILKLSSPSAYNIVRSQLYELIAKPESILSSITAENYIRSKTRLSRSSLMRILSELKNDGYIVIDRGVLKRIVHLPVRD
ncbi:TPA: helix-turn-helix domain-containing protein [Citrobacter farmeri]|uniref:Crp/Fnr family transcriptional regulator n=1 Tax=Citrobacter farmeri TaxID=67824 RepID=UPI00388F728E|nr:helix-turn-helix domain-containing protein [Citrobacter farmeri]